MGFFLRSDNIFGRDGFPWWRLNSLISVIGTSSPNSPGRIVRSDHPKKRTLATPFKAHLWFLNLYFQLCAERQMSVSIARPQIEAAGIVFRAFGKERLAGKQRFHGAEGKPPHFDIRVGARERDSESL